MQQQAFSRRRVRPFGPWASPTIVTLPAAIALRKTPNMARGIASTAPAPLGSPTIEEFVATAQRRELAASHVPIPVWAISSQ